MVGAHKLILRTFLHVTSNLVRLVSAVVVQVASVIISNTVGMVGAHKLILRTFLHVTSNLVRLVSAVVVQVALVTSSDASAVLALKLVIRAN
jgi:hypothetical protein